MNYLEQLSNPTAEQIAARNQFGTPVPQGTSAPNTPATTQPTTAKKTIGEILNGGMTEEDKNIQTLADQYKTQATTPIDETAIRKNIMDRLQTEIDAVNQVYARKLDLAQQEGQGRLGSGAAIQARRGLLGSDFGTAQTQKISTFNTEEQNAIDQERAAKIAAIQSNGEMKVSDEIEKKRLAARQGADDYLKFLGEKKSRETTRTSEAAAALLAAGIDPTTASQSDLSAVAKSYGISSDALVKAFKAQYSDKQEAELKAKKLEADTQKALADANKKPSPNELYGTGAIGEYNFAVANGYKGSFSQYQNEDANRKRPVVNVSTGGGGGLTPYQANQTFLGISNKFQADPIVNAAVKGQTAIAIANQVLANPSSPTNQLKGLYSLVKNLDPDSAVREGELSLAAQTQSYLDRFQSSITRINSGQVISPKAAADLAQATKELASAWNSTAQKRTKQYEAQANVANVGSQFNQYTKAANLNFNEPQSNVITAPDGTQIELID